MNQPLSKSGFLEAKNWLAKNPYVLPPQIHQVAEEVFREHWALLESKGKSLETLKRLREQMGFSPKSEKGSQEKHGLAI
jgi:endo-1,4-beta-D-glucanase Y